MKKQLETLTETQHRCNFCNRVFQREQSLVVHMCEPKRRHQERTDVGVNIGLQAYVRFYEITQGSARARTWDDFVTSSFYRAFVKFGRYCQATRAINITRFTEWLINKNVKIDNWCSDSVYEKYLLELTRIEAAADSVRRATECALDWQDTTQNPARDYLRYGGRNKICHDITTGRITAWILYNTDSGAEFLSDLNAEQIAIVWPWIDTDVWQSRLRDYADDAAWVRDTMSKQGW